MEVAFTDRHGGVSRPPYDSLNLADGGGDDPAAVAENVRRVEQAFAGSGGSGTGRLVAMHQVHGDRVVPVGPDADETPGSCDGLVTSSSDLGLMVRAADCVPVLLADVGTGVVAAVHAGRKGVVAGVVPAAIERMREHGAAAITAWVGPHICGRCYEVPDALRSEVAARVPATYAETSWGTPSLDLGSGVRAQLAAADAEVVVVEGCTRERDDLYSYRRDGAGSGRAAGLVRWLA